MRGQVKLVVAPHPDDEVLGLGGALARWSREGHAVHVLVVTRGFPPFYSPEEEDACRREALQAHARLGVASSRFLDLPAAALDTLAHRELNQRILEAVEALAPQELYLPFPGDLHRDHQLVAHAGLVAARPNRPGHPLGLFAYETLSETNWNAPGLAPPFIPDRFVDITGTLEDKLEAFALYRSQIRPAPHERSLAALRALGTLRGATVGVGAAEALVTIRTIV